MYSYRLAPVLLAVIVSATAQQPADLSKSGSRKPVALVENRGQWAAEARFRARSGTAVAWLTERGLTVTLDAFESVRPTEEMLSGRPYRQRVAGAAFRMTFVNGGAKPHGDLPSATVSHFYRGDPSQWIRNARHFTRVRYPDLYPGVDMVVRGQGDFVAYDLQLSANADLGRVVFRCEGLDGLRIGGDGRLVMETTAGTVHQTAPVAWYVHADGSTEPASCAFRLLGDERYGFELLAPRRNLPLVVDPGLQWSTTFGGSGSDLPHALTVDDATGRVLVCGETYSSDYPATVGPGFAGNRDAFVTVLDPGSATPHVWSAYLGSPQVDYASAIATEPGAQQLAVVGLTAFSGFPTTPNALDPAPLGFVDGFATLMDATGNIVTSTFLGGNANDFANAVVYAGAGQYVVGGNTVSVNFVTTPGVLQPLKSVGFDHFLLKWNANASGASQRAWSTFLGGNGLEGFFDGMLNRTYDNDIFDLDVDSAGNVYAVGRTSSSNFPTTPNAYQATYRGTPGLDIFLTILDPNATSLVYSTLAGINADDGTDAVRAYPGGGAMIGGFTWGRFPPTPGSLDTGYAGRNDALILLFDPSQSGTASLRYAGQLGGSQNDVWDGLDVSSSGVATVSGFTDSNGGIPTTPGAFLTTAIPDFQSVVARVHPRGNGMADLYYSTYLGTGSVPSPILGSGTGSLDVDVDPRGMATVLSATNDPGYPITMGNAPIGAAGGDVTAVTIFDMMPSGTDRVATGTPACGFPVYSGVNSWPQAGNLGFAVNATGAPPSSVGGFLFGGPTNPASGVPILNANMLVRGISGPLVFSDSLGFAEYAIPIPATIPPGSSASFQWLFLTNPACPGSGTLASSERLDLIVQ